MGPEGAGSTASRLERSARTVGKGRTTRKWATICPAFRCHTPGRPHDIANSVVFLTSPAAAYVTGECLYVDGGHILQGPISALPADGYADRS